MATPQMDIALAILRFCPWRERTAVLQLNRAWAGDVRARSWKAFALELEERYQLYVPHQWSERTTAEWRALFLQIFPSAHVWNAVSSDALVPPATHKVTMRVVARFRPKRLRPVDEEAAATVETRVTLPLHQRLQLIKASHGCSSYQAQKLLWAGSDAGHENDPFAAPKGESEARALAPPGTVALVDVTNNSAAGSDEPLEGASLPAVTAPAMTTKAGVVAVNGGEASVVFCAPSIGLREFRFSAAFEARAEQEAVYERSLRPLVIDVLNGRSGCLLCFGQTGSGELRCLPGCAVPAVRLRCPWARECAALLSARPAAERGGSDIPPRHPCAALPCAPSAPPASRQDLYDVWPRRGLGDQPGQRGSPPCRQGARRAARPQPRLRPRAARTARAARRARGACGAPAPRLRDADFLCRGVCRRRNRPAS